ncbi:hypothetical protein ACFX2K_027520 [Malus domestica]
MDIIAAASEDNLISKTERFLSQSVLKSFKKSLRALKVLRTSHTSGREFGDYAKMHRLCRLPRHVYRSLPVWLAG